MLPCWHTSMVINTCFHSDCVLCCAVLCWQVLEGWLQWAAMGVFQQEPFTQAVIAMITQLAGALHTAGKVGAPTGP